MMLYDLKCTYHWVFSESWGFTIRETVIRNAKVGDSSGDPRESYKALFFLEKLDLLKPTKKKGNAGQE